MTRLAHDYQRPVARGHRNGSRQRVSIGFTDAQFRRIANRARNEGTSFNEMVRQLIDRGLAAGARDPGDG